MGRGKNTIPQEIVNRRGLGGSPKSNSLPGNMSSFHSTVVPAVDVAHGGILPAPVQLAKERTLETVVRPVAYILY